MEVEMVSQRAHRMKDEPLKTRWINGKPVVQDVDGRMFAIPAGGAVDDEGASGSGSGELDDEGASGSDDKGGSDGDTVSRAEYDQALERMRSADRAKNQKDTELTELRTFKKEMEDKDRSETDKLTSDRDEAAKQAEESMGRAAAAEMKLAMVLANGKRDKPFRDSEDVLRWVDVSDVTDDDAKLDEKALKATLDKLAEEKPYLLAETSGEEEEEEGKPGPSGTSQNKDKNKGKGIDKDALARKYPALRGR